jgi:hypothetical protein
VVIEQTGYTKPPETDSHVRTDMKLTEHFSLFDLTKTDHTELQAANRDLTDDQVKKLTLLAELLEEIRLVINMPIIVNDGFRGETLNKIDGGVSNSQHALAEAADWVPVREKAGVRSVNDLYPIFKMVWDAAKVGKFKFGQLIYESKSDTNCWFHLSLGFPYRDISKCGQVLTMKNGKYDLIDTISQNI